MNFDLSELDPCRRVWFAVLAQAIEDVMNESGFVEFENRTARRWFKSQRSDVGSFNWVCAAINLDPEIVLERVRERLRDVREHPGQESTEGSIQGSDE